MAWVLRYVERNALRANLNTRAEEWRWSSLWRRLHPGVFPEVPLAEGPLPLPADWIDQVNQPQTEAESEALRYSVDRGAPFGNPAWQTMTATKLQLELTLRPRRRPRKNRM